MPNGRELAERARRALAPTGFVVGSLLFWLLAECESGPGNTIDNLVGSAFELKSNRMTIRENMNHGEDALMTLDSNVIASLGNLS